MGKWIKKHKFCSAAVAIAVIVSVILIKINVNNIGFWNASVVDISTIILVGFITVLISELGVDQRRRTDCIIHVIDDIEQFMSNDNNFEIDDEINMKYASYGNRIKYLKDANFPDISADAEFIHDHFEVIRDLYSNHFENPEEFKSIKRDFDKQRSLIIDKCNKIRIEMYK